MSESHVQENLIDLVGERNLSEEQRSEIIKKNFDLLKHLLALPVLTNIIIASLIVGTNAFTEITTTNPEIVMSIAKANSLSFILMSGVFIYRAQNRYKAVKAMDELAVPLENTPISAAIKRFLIGDGTRILINRARNKTSSNS